jgi:hypothetical protein
MLELPAVILDVTCLKRATDTCSSSDVKTCNHTICANVLSIEQIKKVKKKRWVGVHSLTPNNLMAILANFWMKIASNEYFFLSALFFACRTYSRGSSCESIWNGTTIKLTRFPHLASLCV